MKEAMEAMEKESVLRDLQEQRMETLEKLKNLDQEIKEQKKIIGQGKGEIVQFLSDLKCGDHPRAKFVELKKIPCSQVYKEGKIIQLGIYACSECSKKHKMIIPMAYDCSNCGTVKGSYVVKDCRSSEELWSVLVGREGESYYCRICDSLLGKYYYKISYIEHIERKK